MSIYISIDESYSVSKFTSIKSVVNAHNHLTTVDGKSLTAKMVKDSLKEYGSIVLFDYDDDELEHAISNGHVRGVEWEIKIQKL